MRRSLILAGMPFSVSTYLPGSTPLHACDARAKVALLFAYSATLLAVRGWAGMALCTAALGAAMVVGRLPLGRLARLMVPLYGLLAFTLLFASLSYGEAPGEGAAVALPFAPIALSGAGFAGGCLTALRVLLLAFASLAVTFTTSAEELVDALRFFLAPLRRVCVPVDDVATALSLAVRFIPVLAEELGRVRAAQESRGARFAEGGLFARLGAWGSALIPLFVGLFRRADRLAVAMTARCYGAASRRSSLSAQTFNMRDGGVVVTGLAFCALCVVVG